jgi:hypothetical protein
MVRYWFSLILGLLLGLAVSLIYLIAFPFAVRPMIPYTVAEVLLIISLITTIAICRKDLWLGIFIRTTMVAAVIFLLFALIIIGTTIIPAGIIKIILTLIGSMSYGVTLMVFAGLISYLVRIKL